MAELDHLLRKTIEAQRGDLSKEEEASLAEELKGYMIPSSNGMLRQDRINAINDHDWNVLAGMLRNLRDENEIRLAGGISVNTSAMANASVKIDFDIDQFIELSDVIDKSEGFTDEEKCQLKSLVGDMVKSGKSGDHVTFSDRAAKWLGMTADATELWVAFAPTIATILTSLANQLGG